MNYLYSLFTSDETKKAYKNSIAKLLAIHIMYGKKDCFDIIINKIKSTEFLYRLLLFDQILNDYFIHLIIDHIAEYDEKLLQSIPTNNLKINDNILNQIKGKKCVIEIVETDEETDVGSDDISSPNKSSDDEKIELNKEVINKLKKPKERKRRRKTITETRLLKYLNSDSESNSSFDRDFLKTPITTIPNKEVKIHPTSPQQQPSQLSISPSSQLPSSSPVKQPSSSQLHPSSKPQQPSKPRKQRLPSRLVIPPQLSSQQLQSQPRELQQQSPQQPQQSPPTQSPQPQPQPQSQQPQQPPKSQQPQQQLPKSQPQQQSPETQSPPILRPIPQKKKPMLKPIPQSQKPPSLPTISSLSQPTIPSQLPPTSQLQPPPPTTTTPTQQQQSENSSKTEIMEIKKEISPQSVIQPAEVQEITDEIRNINLLLKEIYKTLQDEEELKPAFNIKKISPIDTFPILPDIYRNINNFYYTSYNQFFADLFDLYKSINFIKCDKNNGNRLKEIYQKSIDLVDVYKDQPNVYLHSEQNTNTTTITNINPKSKSKSENVSSSDEYTISVKSESLVKRKRKDPKEELNNIFLSALTKVIANNKVKLELVIDPPDLSIYPLFPIVVKNPVYISTIKDKIEKRVYTRSSYFHHDFIELKRVYEYFANSDKSDDEFDEIYTYFLECLDEYKEIKDLEELINKDGNTLEAPQKHQKLNDSISSQESDKI